MECSGLTGISDKYLSLQNHGRTGLPAGPVCRAETDRVPASVSSGMQVITGSAGRMRAAISIGSIGIEFTSLDGPSAPMPILLSKSGDDWTTVSTSSGFEVACRMRRSRPARWYWRLVRRVESAVAG